jgi:hypothetical protein
MKNNNLVTSSYSHDDVTILLQDLKGRVPVLDTKEREKLNQSGVHYSEMLPIEYVPSHEYLKIYENALKSQGKQTAQAVVNLAHKILSTKNSKENTKENSKEIVLVSLARAGTPIGILLKRYLSKYCNCNVSHYTISIIRGKGIDIAAMNYIISKHNANDIVFVDGWIGKGAINHVLADAVSKLNITDLSPELAVLSDPAFETNLYGTRDDFLIPSACLNSTVSGLISRTVKLKDMTDNELHGAVYYSENKDFDLSNAFLDEITNYFPHLQYEKNTTHKINIFKGIDEVKKIASEFDINDINKIKPGVGETIRVLLRRVPEVILIKPNANPGFIEPILRLAKEKNVPIKEYPMIGYNTCGIIKDVSDL